ncbi:hypothetical protein ACTA71_008912 [Dictyostelium dimigraforme]
MSVLYKSLFLIVIINILIISVKSYSLKQYDYGEYHLIQSGSTINKKFQVSKSQLLNFQIELENSFDSHAVRFSITSDGGEEDYIIYASFDDVVASGKNSNKSEESTPQIYNMCIPEVFSFSIQMNNLLFGGDIIISLYGQSDDSHCYQQQNSGEETYNSNGSEKKDSSIFITPNGYYTVTSNTSTLFPNGILIVSILTLFFNLLI